MPRLAPVMATRFPLRYDPSYTLSMLRYRSLFSFLARANRAGWSAIVYRSSDMASDVVVLLVVALETKDLADDGVANAETWPFLVEAARKNARIVLLLSNDGILGTL